MSGLRDARLRRALDEAPDAHALPSPAARRAVLDAARAAVAPAPWWRRLWDGMGTRRAPWNAAFATVLLASLVTVLWQDKEVPGARPQEVAQQSAPPSAPAQAPAETSAPATAPPPTVEKRKERPTPSVAPASQEAARAEAFQREKERSAVAKAAPAPEDRARKAAESTAAPVLADVPASAPPPMAAAAPPAQSAPAGAAAPQPAPLAAAPARAARRDSAAAPWTHVRITWEGRTVSAARADAAALPALLEQAVLAAQGNEPLDAPVTARLEFSRDGGAAGVLELAGSQLRWQGRTGRPDATLLAALQAEIARLAPR